MKNSLADVHCLSGKERLKEWALRVDTLSDWQMGTCCFNEKVLQSETVRVFVQVQLCDRALHCLPVN